MAIPHSDNALQIAGVGIRQDAEGRFCLNDLHRAAGGDKRHQPSDWLRLQQTSELMVELTDPGNPGSVPVTTQKGGHEQGTFVCRELVYAYAMWISATFHLRVIRAYDAMVAPKTPQSFADALQLAADQARQLEHQQAQLEQQRPAVEFMDRYVEARSSKSFREVAKVLSIPEKRFIQKLLEDGVVFRQGGALLPKAEHQHRGYFEVKTGEAHGHAYHQTRFTPSGVAWAAKRYGESEASVA